MIPVRNINNERRGTCFRACLASILEMDIDMLPRFEHFGIIWLWVLFFWLKKNGYILKGIGKPGDIKKHNGIDGYVIVFGLSDRGTKHAVIYKDYELYHDPHSDNTGLLIDRGFYIIEKR